MIGIQVITTSKMILAMAISNSLTSGIDGMTIETARQLAAKEGILAGISAGANVWAAIQVSHRKESEGKTIVTVICDTGERYISTEMYE